MARKDEDYVAWGVRIAKQKNKLWHVLDQIYRGVRLYGRDLSVTKGDLTVSCTRFALRVVTIHVTGPSLNYTFPATGSGTIRPDHRPLVEKALARYCFELGVALAVRRKGLEMATNELAATEGRLTMSIHALGGMD